MLQSRKSSKLCAVCYSLRSDESMMRCVRCRLRVHSSCYGCNLSTSNTDRSNWKCRYCNAACAGQVKDYPDSRKAIKCRICNQYKFGALKSCGSKKGFAHLVCALWTPFTYVHSWHMAPIVGIEKCQEYEPALKRLLCDICKRSHATIKCRVKSCRTFYHPLCLMETHRHCMIDEEGVVDSASTRVQYTYCPHHVNLHKKWDPRCAKRKNNRKREVEFVETKQNDNQPVEQNDNQPVDHDDVDVDVVVDDVSSASHANSGAKGTKFPAPAQFIQAPKLSSTINPMSDLSPNYDEFAIDPRHYLPCDANVFSPPRHGLRLDSSFMQTPNSVRDSSTQCMPFKSMLSPTPDLLQLHEMHSQPFSPSITYPFSRQYPGNGHCDNDENTPTTRSTTTPVVHGHKQNERVNWDL